MCTANVLVRFMTDPEPQINHAHFVQQLCPPSPLGFADLVAEGERPSGRIILLQSGGFPVDPEDDCANLFLPCV